MNKAELIKFVQGATNLTGINATDAVNAIVEGMSVTLSTGTDVTLQGFGTFTVKTRAARTGRNPRTGEAIDIPAGKTVKFKAGKHLKEMVK